MAVVLVGCAGPLKVSPIEITELPVKFVDNKNYEIGKVKTANVGSPMIYRQKYALKRWIDNSVITANKKVAFNGQTTGSRVRGLNEYASKQFNKGEKIKLTGSVELEGVTHYVLPIGVSSERVGGVFYECALINPETWAAHPRAGLQGGGGLYLVGEMSKAPLDAKFTSAPMQKVQEDGGIKNSLSALSPKSIGYINNQLIYTGYSGNQISLLYREFSVENFSRTAFFQNLQYQLKDGKASIRFKDIAIDIQKVSNQSITFVVIEH